MVVCGQPLAAQAGLDVLQSGGSAIDAAIATAGVLTVCDPVTAGLGGQLIGQVFDAGAKELFALRGVGDTVGGVALPGVVNGLTALQARFARKPLADLLAPAIELADSGVPIAPRTAGRWNRWATRLQSDAAQVHPLLPGGEPPTAGQVVPLPDLAATLRLIALRGRAPIYEGDFASGLLTFLNQREEVDVSSEQLARQQAEWFTPPQVTYRTRQIATLPGSAAVLESLLLLAPYRLRRMQQQSPALVHLLLEATRLAEQDTAAIETRLDPAAALTRRRQIDPNRAQPHASKRAGDSSTGLVTADTEGNVCLLTLDMGQPFGSGRLLPGSGVLLAEPSDAQPLAICVLDDGLPTTALTVCGPGEPTLLAAQTLVDLIDFAESPSNLLHQPRLHRTSGQQLTLEAAWPAAVRTGLAQRGHDPMPQPAATPIGRVELLQRQPIRRTLIGTSDPRGDGAAAGF